MPQWSKDGKANVVLLTRRFMAQDGPTAYELDLCDLFIALLIIRRGGPTHLAALIRAASLWDMTALLSDNPSLQEVADRINVIELIKAGPAILAAGPDATTPVEIGRAAQIALERVLKRTLLFPPALFACLEKPIHGVGFREFHLVKQHIRGYELGEVAR